MEGLQEQLTGVGVVSDSYSNKKIEAFVTVGHDHNVDSFNQDMFYILHSFLLNTNIFYPNFQPQQLAS